MPELPEVETMRRGVLPVVGSEIVLAERPPCHLRPILLTPRIDAFNRRLRGQKITGIGRRGKRVVIEIEDDQFLVIEPRMTGLVLLADPPDRSHLRLRLKLTQESKEAESYPQLLFWDRRGLGTVRLMNRDEFGRLVEARLGPDALHVSAAELREVFRPSRREVKVALLDQSKVAGIGNLYAAEILFLAGVDPRARCDRLTRSQWERIERATHRVLRDAIEHEGSTLSDGTYRNALNGEGGYQSFHRVYDRRDSECPRCKKGQIQRDCSSSAKHLLLPRLSAKEGAAQFGRRRLKFFFTGKGHYNRPTEELNGSKVKANRSRSRTGGHDLALVDVRKSTIPLLDSKPKREI